MATVLQGGSGGTVESSGRLALTFQEGFISAVSSALIRIATKSSSLVLASGPLSCVLLTTSSVPVLPWSPGSHSVQVSPLWQLPLCICSYLSPSLFLEGWCSPGPSSCCLSIYLVIYLSSVYTLSHCTQLHSFHHPHVCAHESPELQTYPSACLRNFSF